MTVMDKLLFKTIDLSKHADIAIRFREDSFRVSFGHADDFHEADGLGSKRYLEWLSVRIGEYPDLHVHVWCEGEIIGQLEGRFDRQSPTVGYVNLYYLAPEWRGRGLASALDHYMCDVFNGRGCHAVRLSVSPTNARAIKFYTRHGWTDQGPRSDGSEVHLMEKDLMSP